MKTRERKILISNFYALWRLLWHYSSNLLFASGHKPRSKKNSGKMATQLIVEASATYTAAKTYDIFLSHSVRDAELILGMKGTLEDLRYSVYVDWIEDTQLDRSKVTPATADKLRQRMNSSKSLFYITTANSDASRWMPWECGYFDGKKEKVAIVPIQKTSTDNTFVGQEYLDLYPYVVKNNRGHVPFHTWVENSSSKKEELWVRKSHNCYVLYDNWVKTPNFQVEWTEG